ncbi:MAG: alpha/beta hydrolase [Anaeromyxobacteraceae bacterium]
MPATSILERLAVRVVGEGPRVVVLAHGFGSTQTAWDGQVAALAPRCRLVLFDHLGCGKAADGYDPDRYDALDAYARDLLAIHAALGLEWDVYVGHSAAGMIGVLASLARPDLFDRLVLLGASPRYLDDTGYVGGFTRGDLDALYRAMARDYLGWANGFGPVAMGNPGRPSLGAAFAQSLGGMRPDVAQSVARAIFESDFRSRLGEVQVPTLVLQSRNDVAVPMEVGTYLARHIPRSRLRVLDAEGHFPHVSAPEQVNGALVEELALVA